MFYKYLTGRYVHDNLRSLDLIKQLKNIYPDLKGIAISGFGMDADIQKSKEAGFIIHLIKPVSVAKLESAIEQIECD